MFQKTLADVEGAKYCIATSSGMAACDLVCRLMKPGDHIIVSDDLYGGCTGYFLNIAKDNGGLNVDAIDLRDLKVIEATFKSNTKLVWVETPTNPTLKIIDIEGISKLCKAHNAILAVDNTFMTPFLQSPLKLGADIVIHSCTKYIGGHSDIIMGAVLTSDDKIYEVLRKAATFTGGCPGPFDCYLATRGLKTLGLRVSRSQESAMKLAELLENHPKVEKVLYPGLKSHPGYELSKKQTRGTGSMISVFIKGGSKAANTFYNNLVLFGHAVSLGGVESLVSLPVMVTHKPVPPEIREKLGITDNMVRLSVGIEDYEDLKNDITHALDSI